MTQLWKSAPRGVTKGCWDLIDTSSKLVTSQHGTARHCMKKCCCSCICKACNTATEKTQTVTNSRAPTERQLQEDTCDIELLWQCILFTSNLLSIKVLFWDSGPQFQKNCLFRAPKTLVFLQTLLNSSVISSPYICRRLQVLRQHWNVEVKRKLGRSQPSHSNPVPSIWCFDAEPPFKPLSLPLLWVLYDAGCFDCCVLKQNQSESNSGMFISSRLDPVTAEQNEASVTIKSVLISAIWRIWTLQQCREQNVFLSSSKSP